MDVLEYVLSGNYFHGKAVVVSCFGDLSLSRRHYTGLDLLVHIFLFHHKLVLLLVFLCLVDCN